MIKPSPKAEIKTADSASPVVNPSVTGACASLLRDYNLSEEQVALYEAEMEQCAEAWFGADTMERMMRPDKNDSEGMT
ncbi:unknown protein [Seminavis robusta]|uniref:Uncharacterized protein n=1 Tax=Seminavis robusta TaxID=568900 RepID=A0A9N8EYB8_9STRA|nr:unknown protein [Seminavis robusta]|eukprot:Sro2524_g330230.1 n/a (78) ;mRNA; f:4393-4626